MKALALAALLAAGMALAAGPSLAQHAHGGPQVLLVATERSGQPFAFEPQDLTIEAGRTVRWLNQEDVFHTITSSDSLQVKRPNGKFDGTVSAANESFAFTFDEPGTYPYYCQPHSPFMYGTVTVVAPAAASPPVPPQAPPGGPDAPPPPGGERTPGPGAWGPLLAGLAALALARRTR